MASSSPSISLPMVSAFEPAVHWRTNNYPALQKTGAVDYAFREHVAGVIIAHAAHGLSVLVLYCLGCAIFSGRKGRMLAFIAACLHIFSPAGLFLSAPYGESTYALLSFTGYFLFVQSFSPSGASTSLKDALIPPSWYPVRISYDGSQQWDPQRPSLPRGSNPSAVFLDRGYNLREISPATRRWRGWYLHRSWFCGPAIHRLPGFLHQLPLYGP